MTQNKLIDVYNAHETRVKDCNFNECGCDWCNAYRSTLTPPETQGALDALDDMRNRTFMHLLQLNVPKDAPVFTNLRKESQLIESALTRPSREEKLLNEIVSAYNDLHEFFDVDNGTEPDGDSIGWQGDMELPTTFGQLRRLKQAIAEAGE